MTDENLDRIRNILDEIPVPRGHIRLYRGSSSTRDIQKASFIRELFPEMEEVAGRWFTNSLDDALYYATTVSGDPRLFFIDIAENIVEDYKASNMPRYKHLVYKPQNEFIIPPVYFQHLREIPFNL